MKYYLETNAIYGLAKVPESLLKSSYTSVLTLLELLSGMEAESYATRKAAVKKIFDWPILVDWAMPEEIIFEAFDFFDDDGFGDRRTGYLVELIQELRSSSTYQEYIASYAYNSEYGHLFFKGIDNGSNIAFSIQMELYMLAVHASFKIDEHEIFTVDNKTYLINSPKALKDCLKSEPQLSHGMLINANANMLIELLKLNEYKTDDISPSYNGHIDIYIMAVSRYTIKKICESQTANKNDIFDLLHILYLRDQPHRKIISADKFYKTYLSDQVLSIEDFKRIEP
jgi:hypothetical protein